MDKLIQEASELFKNCGFPYYVCGGFALELFAGKSIRRHSDVDISVFDENKRDVVAHLQDCGWIVYKKIFEVGSLGTVTPISDADDSKLDDIWTIWAINPKTHPGPKLREGETDIYDFEIKMGHVQTEFNFVEIVLDSKDGDDFLCGKSKNAARKLDKAILYKDGVPYMAPEVVLFLKSNKAYMTHDFHKAKTPADYKTIAPLLPSESRQWLIDALDKAYPDGYEWLDTHLQF